MVYFIVNTNATRFAENLKPAATGAKWRMDPMTGEVRPTGDRVELEPYESGGRRSTCRGARPT